MSGKQTITEELDEGNSADGRSGLVGTAADGYKPRCDCVRVADEEQLTFSEIAPGSEQ